MIDSYAFSTTRSTSTAAVVLPANNYYDDAPDKPAPLAPTAAPMRLPAKNY